MEDMKKLGYLFFAMGLFLFGLLPVQIPVACFLGGIAAIILDKEFKL